MQAIARSALLSSLVKACFERMSKEQPEIYLAFSNLEVLVGFAKSDRTEVGLVQTEELIEVKTQYGERESSV